MSSPGFSLHVQDSQVRAHERELVREVNAGGVLREKAHCEAKHDPAPVVDLVGPGPAEEPGAGRR